MKQQQHVAGQRLALDLVNSTYIQGGTRGRLVDSINTCELLQDWCVQRIDQLAAAGHPGEINHEDLQRIIRLREATRHLLEALCNDEVTNPDDVMVVSEGASQARRLVSLSLDLDVHYDWSTSDFGKRVITLIAEDAISLLAGKADGVYACQAPGCIMYFIPTTERRRWCSATCGNRARVARHHRK